MKSKRRLKVFYGLENFGTQAGILASAMRSKGIKALSVVGVDPYKRQIDICLYKNVSHTWIRSIYNWIRRFIWFFSFNTFHFFYGTSLFPRHLDLPLYRFFGKKVIMEYLGADIQKYDISLKKYGIYTNVTSYFKNGEEHDAKVNKRYSYESRYIDQKFVCAPYLSEFVEGVPVLPLAIDLNQYKYLKKELGPKISFLHAPSKKNNKGTNYIISVLERLESEGYMIEYEVAEDIDHSELVLRYQKCDIFIDQLSIGWYGTAAIEAMAIGRPVVCFIREDYFQYIEYGQDIPIINANITTIYDVLLEVIEKKDQFDTWGKKSRSFVEKIHDVDIISDDLIKRYNTLWQ